MLIIAKSAVRQSSSGHVKVVQGGLIAGDDYHEKFPLVVEAVNAVVAQYDFEIILTTKVETGTRYSSYPAWAVIKTKPTPVDAPTELVEQASPKVSQYKVVN